MKKQVTVVLSVCAVFLLAALAFAQEVPTPEGDMGGFLKFLIGAFTAKNWSVFTGAVLMLIIYGVRSLVELPKPVLGILSPLTGVVLAFVTFSIAGLPWHTALFNGLFVGAAGNAWWSAVGKLLLPKPKDKKEEKKDG